MSGVLVLDIVLAVLTTDVIILAVRWPRYRPRHARPGRAAAGIRRLYPMRT